MRRIDPPPARRATLRRLACRALCCLAALAAFPRLEAQEGRAYVYSFWKEPVPTPPAYLPAATVDGRALGIGDFNQPEDIFVRPDGSVFIADTRNNRIVRLGPDWKPVRVYETFLNAGARDSFRQPGGVFATADAVYVADTGRRRVVVLSLDGALRQIVGRPQSDLLRDDYTHLPARLAVDRAGRLYLVGPGMYEGIMELNQDGSFSGFLGSNRVRFNLADYAWKRIATERQRQALMLFIPEELSNLDIDEQGFIYCTTRNEEAKHPVKKLNAEGIDVLRREGFFPPAGDVAVNHTGTIRGASSFVDVAVDQNGIYHCLDAKRGRVFSYNQDGDLLSVIGGPGSQVGLLQDPVSLELQNGRLLVLDRALGRITVFEPTGYGRLLREAIVRYSNGDYDAAYLLWDRLLAMNANLELGYSGLGKVLLRRKDYPAAMRLFRLANNRRYYSKAFRLQRRLALRRLAPWLLSALLAAALAAAARRLARSRRPAAGGSGHLGPNPPLHRRLGFAFYLLGRPFDGFWYLKHERIGTVRSAAVMVALYLAAVTVKTVYSGFLFNTTDLSRYSLLEAGLKSLLPVGLFCLGNWSLTSLMEGEGSMRDIFIATAYALAPLILIFPAIAAASHALTLEEGALYHFLDTLAWLWTGGLVFVGNKTVHNYTARKTLGMLLLTLIAIGVILFLFLLLVTFIEQVASFGRSLYREILFRM